MKAMYIGLLRPQLRRETVINVDFLHGKPGDVRIIGSGTPQAPPKPAAFYAIISLAIISACFKTVSVANICISGG